MQRFIDRFDCETYYTLSDPGEKRPMRAFGGWPEDNDYRPDPDHSGVLSGEQVLDIDDAFHPLLLGTNHPDKRLLILDIDAYKMSEEERGRLDEGDWQNLLDVALVVQTQSGGLHVYIWYDGHPDDLKTRNLETHEHVDLKGEAAKGYALIPDGEKYEIANDGGIPSYDYESLLELPIFHEPDHESPNQDTDFSRNREVDHEVADLHRTTNTTELFALRDSLDVEDVPDLIQSKPSRKADKGVNWTVQHRDSDSGDSMIRWDSNGQFHDKSEDGGTGDWFDLYAAEQDIINTPNHPNTGDQFWETCARLSDEGVFPEHVEADPFVLGSLPDPDPSADDTSLDIEQVRDQLDTEIRNAMTAEDATTVDSPTGSGKSHTSSTTRWTEQPETGGEPVILAHQNNDTRDQQIERSQAEEGVDHAALRGRQEILPDFPGVTYDGKDIHQFCNEVCGDSGVGMPLSAAIDEFDRNNDQNADLDWDNSQWDGVPRDDDGEPAADVIHCSHQFLRVPSLRRNTNVVIDEEPDFTIDMGHDRATKAIEWALETVGAETRTGENIESWTWIARSLEQMNGANEYLSVLETQKDLKLALKTVEVDLEEFFKNPFRAHTLAFALTRAMIKAYESDPDANGWRSAKVSYMPAHFDADPTDQNRLTITVDRHDRIRSIRDVPDFSICRSVVGLEEDPDMFGWQRNTVPWNTSESVLTPQQENEYRKHIRNLNIVQVGDYRRPAGNSSEDTKRPVWMNHLADEYPDWRTGVTNKDDEERFTQQMRDAGVDDPGVMTKGADSGRNDFDGERVGYVDGYLDPGDRPVKGWLAEHGKDAVPERNVHSCEQCSPGEDPSGVDCDHCPCHQCGGSGCDGCSGTGWERAKGRGWVGPDADTAEALFKSVAVKRLKQAAGRYARSPDDPDDGARVFVRSNMLPDRWVDYKIEGVTREYGEKQRRILERVRDSENRVTTPEIVDTLDIEISRKHVWQTLRDAAERGHVDVDNRAGPGGSHYWNADGSLDIDGDVDFAELVTSRVLEEYSVEVTTPGPEPRFTESGPVGDGDWGSLEAQEVDPPPDSAD